MSLKLTKMSLKESEKTLRLLEIQELPDPTRTFLKDMSTTEDLEPVESNFLFYFSVTDQEKKEEEEETSEIWRTNSTRTNTKIFNRLASKSKTKNQRKRNPNLWLWLSTTKARASMSTSKLPRRTLLETKLTLSGLRRKSSKSWKPRRTREDKKLKISKTWISKTTPELRWTATTAKCLVSEQSPLLKDSPEKKSLETTEAREEKELTTRQSSTTMISPPSDHRYPKTLINRSIYEI